MANEARVTSNLAILKRSSSISLIEHRGQGPSAFVATVTGTKGPLPGSVTVTGDGVDVSFSGLTIPSLCEIHNQSSSGFVSVGIWEPNTSLFYPLLDVHAGEKYTLRLSRYLRQQFEDTGTGTGGANQTLRLKAFQENGAEATSSVSVYVGAFEK